MLASVGSAGPACFIYHEPCALVQQESHSRSQKQTTCTLHCRSLFQSSVPFGDGGSQSAASGAAAGVRDRFGVLQRRGRDRERPGGAADRAGHERVVREQVRDVPDGVLDAPAADTLVVGRGGQHRAADAEERRRRRRVLVAAEQLLLLLHCGGEPEQLRRGERLRAGVLGAGVRGCRFAVSGVRAFSLSPGDHCTVRPADVTSSVRKLECV